MSCLAAFFSSLPRCRWCEKSVRPPFLPLQIGLFRSKPMMHQKKKKRRVLERFSCMKFSSQCCAIIEQHYKGSFTAQQKKRGRGRFRSIRSSPITPRCGAIMILLIMELPTLPLRGNVQLYCGRSVWCVACDQSHQRTITCADRRGAEELRAALDGLPLVGSSQQTT